MFQYVQSLYIQGLSHLNTQVHLADTYQTYVIQKKHASLFKCFSMSNLFGKKVKSCEYKVITLNYKQVGVFIKKDTQDIEVHHRNLC